MVQTQILLPEQVASQTKDALLTELRRVELVSRKRMTADLIGQYSSAFRGSGVIFSDLREYQPGDDIRQIHWKASARSERVYVKSYEEDRQCRVLLAIDISASTNFGSINLESKEQPTFISKHRRALEFAALISQLAQQHNDALGLCLFSDQVELFLAPARSRSKVKQVLFELSKVRTLKPATNIQAACNYLNQHQRKNTLVFLISDFLSQSNWETEFKLLARRHDVINVMLSDSLDFTLPDAGLVRYTDFETGESLLVDSSSRRIREKLNAREVKRRLNLKDLCRQAGADLLELTKSPVRSLMELMHQRMARVR